LCDIVIDTDNNNRLIVGSFCIRSGTEKNVRWLGVNVDNIRNLYNDVGGWRVNTLV
jgi:hypothetical protein